MTDIVERLRDAISWLGPRAIREAEVMRDAADEIERLREALEKADEGLNYVHLYSPSPPGKQERE